MATTDDLYRIIMQVENAADVQRLTELEAQLTQQLHTVVAATNAQSVASRQAAAALQTVQSQLAAAQGASRNWGRATLEASRGLEDLQYGVAGVLNNIPSFITSVGGSAGVAGALSIAAVAAKVLYDHWDDLARLFGQGHVKTQAEEMEELRKKTELTATEAERLARADNLSGKVKELRSGKTKDQKSEEAAATEAMIEAGAGNVARGIIQTAPDLVDSQGEAAVAAEKKRIAQRELDSAKAAAGDSEDPYAVAAAERKLAEADLALGEARRATAAKIAATGALPAEWAGNRQRIADLARQNPGAFGPNGAQLAKDLDAADPAAQKQAASDEHYRKQDEEIASKKAAADEQLRQEQRDSDAASDEHYRKQDEEIASKKAASDEKLRQDKTDQFVAIGMKALINDRSSQVLSGGAALRDSIQSSIKTDNTPLEQLRSQQRSEGYLRQLAERNPGLVTATVG